MNIFDTLINASEVIIKDIGLMHIEMIIIAIVISAISFYISKWFRAYILRLIIFILGASLTLDHGKSKLRAS